MTADAKLETREPESKTQSLAIDMEGGVSEDQGLLEPQNRG